MPSTAMQAATKTATTFCILNSRAAVRATRYASTKRTAKPPTTPATQPTPRTATARPPTTPAEQPASNPLPKRDPPPKWKRILWTVCFAAVTITGTIYGAGLKTQQQWKAEKQRIQEASIDEKVSILEQRKADLLRQKGEIEAKLAMLRARMEATAAAAAAAGGGGDDDGHSAGEGKQPSGTVNSREKR
ncbi:hypothetical protein N656DRAFT_841276 [Canariomyces notabilis]|uniref:Uncharacterized protein n=1 Tax=Canariomyces notabilis TaxID=2074819 RepID=A0AAN6TP86_9PEZI|nr:hypothetical protein N656DRAFT_841276 [Canariomyces arenarius]